MPRSGETFANDSSPQGTHRSLIESREVHKAMVDEGWKACGLVKMSPITGKNYGADCEPHSGESQLYLHIPAEIIPMEQRQFPRAIESEKPCGKVKISALTGKVVSASCD